MNGIGSGTNGHAMPFDEAHSNGPVASWRSGEAASEAAASWCQGNTTHQTSCVKRMQVRASTKNQVQTGIGSGESRS
jgi:hypothetical protein